MTQVLSTLSDTDRRRIADALDLHAAECISRGIEARNDGASIDPYQTAATLAAQAADVYRKHRAVTGEDWPPPLVTKREKDVVGLLAAGLTTVAIAHRLGYSDSSVKVVIAGLAERFRLANRAHVVAWAIRKGVI